MSDSDSDSEYDYSGDWGDRDWKPFATHKNDAIGTLHPSDEIFERWSQISVDTRKEAGQRMKVCAFWLPILLQREESSPTACWALQIGLIDSNDSEDLSLKHLHKIETLEAVLRALEKGTLKKDQTKHVVWISNMFYTRSPEVLENALRWLERTEEPAIRHRVLDLGHAHTCFTALHLIFSEFAKYIHKMGTNLNKTMEELLAQPSDYHIEKSEEMKRKGNENFQRKQYEDAVKFYSKAIKFYPDNHIIYGNRALCYIRCKKYLKAVGDGKRATLIKPLWAKGHYRYCEALFFLGEVKMAIKANSSAQSLCKDDHEGIKDLEQQHLKFITELAESKVGQLKKTPSKRSDNKADSAGSQPQSGKAVSNRVGAAISTAPQTKVSQVKTDKQRGEFVWIPADTPDTCGPDSDPAGCS